MKPRTDPVATGRAPALLLLALAVPFAAPALGADWPLVRGNPALTGVADEALPGDLAPVWTFEAGDAIEGTAAIGGGTVFVGSLDGHLYALDLATGALRWKIAAGAEVKSSPSLKDGVVYFGDESGKLHAVEASTGKPRWTFQTDGGVTSGVNFAAGREPGEARLVFGSYDGFLYCLKAADGSLAWKLETESYVHATPAIAGGNAYVSGCDGFFRAVRLSDGGEAGKVSLGGYAAASPAVAGGRAFVGTFENEVLALDLAPLAVAWRYQNPDRAFPFYASAAATPRAIVVGGRDKLVSALDPGTGKKLWSFETPARVDASPVVVGERVFVASMSGDLYALVLASGERVWTYGAGSPIVASPAVGGGLLVIGTEDGTVLAFGAAAKPRP
jgi:outer membrane protein assembly factor BamB